MTSPDPKPLRPERIAVFVSLVICAFVFSVIVGMAGSYAITLHSIDVQHRADVALHQREIESQVRTAIPTCKALVEMDDAKNGASNASSDPNSYGHRLAKAIHDVVARSQCTVILKDLKNGQTIAQIVKELDHQH
jgi:hypothetical protein